MYLNFVGKKNMNGIITTESRLEIKHVMELCSPLENRTPASDPADKLNERGTSRNWTKFLEFLPLRFS